MMIIHTSPNRNSEGVKQISGYEYDYIWRIRNNYRHSINIICEVKE